MVSLEVEVVLRRSSSAGTGQEWRWGYVSVPAARVSSCVMGGGEWSCVLAMGGGASVVGLRYCRGGDPVGPVCHERRVRVGEGIAVEADACARYRLTLWGGVAKAAKSGGGRVE